jgi:aminoglycoside phosphotransferase (APT) family kinase protein
MGAAAPRCFGVHSDSRTGTTCLFLEYLEGAQHPENDTALPHAATWLAHFHRRAEPFASSNEAAFLTRYDREYYAGWARRTAAFTEPLGEQYFWVPGVCERFAQYGAPELERHPTVIHGEYYRKNLLLHHGQLYGIDWESCAVGAAEIDVAMLIEGWPDEPVGEVERHYCRERWPGGAGNFTERLAMAQVYVHFRWLGDQPRWTPLELWRFKELRVASGRAGLLSCE